jgi:hypothetical protein
MAIGTGFVEFAAMLAIFVAEAMVGGAGAMFVGDAAAGEPAEDMVLLG